MLRALPRQGFAAGLLWLAAAIVVAQSPEGSNRTKDAPAAAQPQSIVDKGVRIEFSIEPSGGESITEGAYVDASFRVTDAASGTPVSPLEPAVWVSRTTATEKEMPCKDRIGRFLKGTLTFQADVDLNKYFIMILNNDRSISVVAVSLKNNGITQLYAMVMLEEPGEDWTRDADEQQLFVTMPAAGKVAVVELQSFKVVDTLEVGSRPVRIALQPDGKYLWVGNDAEDEEESGVTIVDVRARRVVARIPTGAGHHEIAFSEDSLFAFVTNRDADSLSIIDVQSLRKVKELATGRTPLAVAFSDLGGAAYVAAQDGTIAVVDGEKLELVHRLETGGGLEAFRLDPSGRWGFAANAVRNRVDVLDISNGSIAHRLEVGERPHQFAFTATYAYVRHLDTADVTLVPLAQLSLETAPGLQRVGFGNNPPGGYPYPATADAISPTGEWTAVVTANPVDKTVYYYMEGMVAPMGSYTTYGRVPRAVGVVDRSVRETEKGVYAAKFRVPESGDYDVAFLMDAPVVGHCFEFSAQPDAANAGLGGRGVEIRYLVDDRRIPAGDSVELLFSLSRGGGAAPLAGIEDVVVLITRPPGSWQERLVAASLGNGVYRVTLPADVPGVYYVSVSVPSLGLDFTDLPYFTLLAVGENQRKSKGS
jgi:YVTN family beta-propeller protein